MSFEVSNGKCRCPDDAKVISSFATAFFKIIFPTLGMVFCGSIIMSFFASEDEGSIGFLVLLSAFILFTFWVILRLKWVAIDRENIYISNFIKMISVPLADIEKVTENVLTNIHPVYITFNHETEFGRKIVFMPKFDLGIALFFFLSHPIVEELRDLVEERKEKKE